MLPTNIPKPEALQVIMRFKAIDKDNSGALALDELVTILMEMLGGRMAESNVRRLASMQFQAADRDKSGTLNVEEFLQIWAFVREQVQGEIISLIPPVTLIFYRRHLHFLCLLFRVL